MTRLRRPGLTTWLTVAVLVALPLLAALQYRWLSRIGEDARSRLSAVTENAGRSLGQDLGFELLRAWNEQAARAEADRRGEARGADAGDRPPLVLDVFVADRVERDDAGVRLRRWDLDRGTCTPADWPESLGTIRDEAASHRSDDGERMAAGLLAAAQRLATSSGLFPALLGREGDNRLEARPPCDVSPPAILLVRYDMERVRGQLVPELVRRHLGGLLGEFRFAIVSGADGRDVVFASPGTDVPAILASPDVVVPVSPRWDLGRRPRPDAAPRGPGGPARRPDEGHGRREGDGWRLVAQHRAGSLEAAVSRLRARNLAVSFGILGLMGIAIAMIAANARKAERLARQQVEFVASVSHEMRTPVAAIDVAARNLEDGVVTDPARIRQYGGVIRAEGRRLGDTIERVLQVAALDAGRGVGPPAAVDVRAMLDELVSRVRHDQPAAVVDVVTGDGPLVAHADAAVLRSCLQNLVGNALKHGGTPPWARVRVEARAQGLCITVEDRGPGIDARDLPHVFDPFYRGRLAVERRSPGNGLGLHIVKRGVEAMGGRVEVRTGHGDGTAFTLHVPASTELPREP